MKATPEFERGNSCARDGSDLIASLAKAEVLRVAIKETANNNIPCANKHYTPQPRISESRSDLLNRATALSEYNFFQRPTGPLSIPQVTAKAIFKNTSGYLKDQLYRWTVSPIESHVIRATMGDPSTPDDRDYTEIVKYVMRTDDGKHGKEVALYMAKRAQGLVNNLVVVKLLLLAHKLATQTDVRFISPAKDLVEVEHTIPTLEEIASLCRQREIGERVNDDGGAALEVMDAFVSYLNILSTHLMNVTKILGTNIFKEKIHKNEFLNRMEMDETLADLTKESTEVLETITKVPVVRELLQLELSRLLLESLISDALCLLGFIAKALENALFARKGTATASRYTKWMNTFECYERAGYSLSLFFDKIRETNVAFSVLIPSILTLPRGAANDLREALSSKALKEGIAASCVGNGDLSQQVYETEFTREVIMSSNSQGESLSNTTEHISHSNESNRAVFGPELSTNPTRQRHPPIVCSCRFTIFFDEIIGKGSYGTVYKAWDGEEGRPVACKQINRRRELRSANFEPPEITETLRKEFELLTSLKHENIVSVISFETSPSANRIFMEWVPGGSVQDIFSRTGRGLSQNVISKYITGALQGLAYMHEKGIVHRDIKPGNMLIDANGAIKIGDFGTSTLLGVVTPSGPDPPFDAKFTSVAGGKIVGTVPYMSPEALRGVYGPHSDIWSLGASAVHMHTGLTPWCEKKFSSVFQLIYHLGSAEELERRPSFNAGLAEINSPTGDFLSFLNDCFTLDSTKRPTAVDLLRHPFVNRSM